MAADSLAWPRRIAFVVVGGALGFLGGMLLSFGNWSLAIAMAVVFAILALWKGDAFLEWAWDWISNDD